MYRGGNGRMLISKNANQCGLVWYVAGFSSGSVAVVSSEDLVFLVPCGSLEFLIKVSYEEGRAFECARAWLYVRDLSFKVGGK